MASFYCVFSLQVRVSLNEVGSVMVNGQVDLWKNIVLHWSSFSILPSDWRYFITSLVLHCLSHIGFLHHQNGARVSVRCRDFSSVGA